MRSFRFLTVAAVLVTCAAAAPAPGSKLAYLNPRPHATEQLAYLNPRPGSQVAYLNPRPGSGEQVA